MLLKSLKQYLLYQYQYTLQCCWSPWDSIFTLTMLLNCLEQYLYAYDVVEFHGTLYLYLRWWRIFWDSISVLMMLLNLMGQYLCTYDVVESHGTVFFCTYYVVESHRTVFLYLRCCWIPWDPSEHCDVAPAEDRPSGRKDRTSSGWYNGHYCKSHIRDGCMVLFGNDVSDTRLISSCNANSQYSSYKIHYKTWQFSTCYLERREIS